MQLDPDGFLYDTAGVQMAFEHDLAAYTKSAGRTAGARLCVRRRAVRQRAHNAVMWEEAFADALTSNSSGLPIAADASALVRQLLDDELANRIAA